MANGLGFRVEARVYMHLRLLVGETDVGVLCCAPPEVGELVHGLLLSASSTNCKVCVSHSVFEREMSSILFPSMLGKSSINDDTGLPRRL
jgi:hypothetical protein